MCGEGKNTRRIVKTNIKKMEIEKNTIRAPNRTASHHSRCVYVCVNIDYHKAAYKNGNKLEFPMEIEIKIEMRLNKWVLVWAGVCVAWLRYEMRASVDDRPIVHSLTRLLIHSIAFKVAPQTSIDGINLY